MADEKKPEEKIKQTVPAMDRSARGIAAHATAVQALQWDKDRKVFKDPFVVTLALFTYAKLTATILGEAEEHIAKAQEALDKRVAEFETRLTTMEKWAAEAEAQTQAMVKSAEEMMVGGPDAFLDKLRGSLPPGSTVSMAPPTVIADAEVVVLPKKDKKPKLVDAETNGEKKGDVA